MTTRHALSETSVPALTAVAVVENGQHETPPTRSPARSHGIHVNAIPGTQARDVVKVAVLPLNAASPSVTVELSIEALTETRDTLGAG